MDNKDNKKGVRVERIVHTSVVILTLIKYPKKPNKQSATKNKDQDFEHDAAPKCNTIVNI